MKNSLSLSLQDTCTRNKDGSFSTQANRAQRLELALEQLNERYKHLNRLSDLKTKHIDYLVERWKAEELSSGTIKNRMSDLRWVAEKINKPNIVRRTNDEYGIGRRQFVNNDVNRAKELTDDRLNQIPDKYIQLSLRLQAEFGLRRKESIMFESRFDKGDYLDLPKNIAGTKTGRPREIPILNEKQRELLNEIREFQREQKATKLIPPEKNYKEQQNHYDKTTNYYGFNNNHGLRHAYAQQRYKELTGFDCPKNGGATWKELSEEQKALDIQARQIVSHELGHNRTDVTSNYLGK